MARGAGAHKHTAPLISSSYAFPPQASSRSGSSQGGRVFRSSLTQPLRLKWPGTSGKGQGLKDESKKSGSRNTLPLGIVGKAIPETRGCGASIPEEPSWLSLVRDYRCASNSSSP